MSFNRRLEIAPEFYEDTKQQIIKNGSKVWEQSFGSRRNLYGDGHLCGTTSPEDYLPLKELSKSQLGAFLGQFTKSLYNQIRKDDSILDKQVIFNGVSRDKNFVAWEEIQPREMFYNVDLSSAYWQMAFRLGYITKRMFNSYLEKDSYKEAKRYCISFLARENEMNYHDGREINHVRCNTDCLQQIYDNIRNELYSCIQNVLFDIKDWIEFNIDGVTIKEKDLPLVQERFDSLNLVYKINECLKIDERTYLLKGKIRKF